MNANELADELDVESSQAEYGYVVDNWKLFRESATMLRQQQAQIDSLKASHIELERGIVKDLNQRQSAEPVAWMLNGILHEFDPSDWAKEQYPDQDVVPLYTHPAKTLTDEEWNKAFDYYCETDEGVLKFDLELRDEWKKEQLIRWKEALRKAQEK